MTYQTAFDRLSIYEKVKILEGENFVTVEDTRALTVAELKLFVTNFVVDLAYETVPNINILISSEFTDDIDRTLRENGFILHDKITNVHKDLQTDETYVDQYFIFKTLHQLLRKEFMDIWQRSMADSPNAPSSLTMEEQMKSVEKELGPTFKDSCIVAYEKDRPIGVVMPHIEPGTMDEGRLFYFGLIPEERGKGKSKPLHRQALGVLKTEFNASYYIGSTSEKNTPMLRTFEASGCTVTERNKLYKKAKNHL